MFVDIFVRDIFQSTLPARGATRMGSVYGRSAKFQSTLPARGATVPYGLEWWDTIFQSTLPARGATYARCLLSHRLAYFNPRSPHGERPGTSQARKEASNISIHAPRTGSDTEYCKVRGDGKIFQSTLPARGATGRRRRITASGEIFQSTLPARGATKRAGGLYRRERISIHAPRTGSDYVVLIRAARGRYFNPRSPHGERLFCCGFLSALLLFQSTLPARGATRPQASHCSFPIHFNPRSPHGERRR